MEMSIVDAENDSHHNEEATVSTDKKKKAKSYPKHIFFIIGNEFCERFSFYGMRTVLVLYARNYLLFDDDASTSIFHAFTVLAYLTPLLGGIVADSYWGKYKTIAYLSVVYVIGHVLKTIAAIPYIASRAVHLILSMLGLFLIALGTGGIKPCVSSFGGDQFSPEQTRYQRQFFSLFYFSINAGALLSKWLTPTFRADLNCYPGHEDDPQFQECFSVAFGIPGLLMLFALLLFLAGTKYYTRHRPEGSIFWKFCKCVFSAIKNKWLSRKNKEMAKAHWIDYAKASKKLKSETKAVLKVLYLFLPLPFFWALFDQQGSRWTLQALQLNGYWGDYLVKPDQIDFINPFLIVTLIPLFEVTLYPLLRKCKVNFTPVRRMTTGLVLAGLSFVCAAILQFQIDKGLTPLPSSNQVSFRIINVSPCNITFNLSSSTFSDFVPVNTNSISNTKSNFIEVSPEFSLQYISCDNSILGSVNLTNRGGSIIDFVVGGKYGNQYFQSAMPTQKLENGKSLVSFINVDYPEVLEVEISNYLLNVSKEMRSDLAQVTPGMGSYAVYTPTNDGKRTLMYNGTVTTNPGGVYTVILNTNSRNSTKLEAVKFHNEEMELSDVNSNNINIGWMIPQYFIITVGEVFLSVTGLEFSYTQAPPSMKSVVTSFWLLTVSAGNLIVLMIAESHAIERQAFEFILFAALIGIAAVIFSFMARGYKPVDQAEFVEDQADRIEETDENSLLT